MSMHALTNGRSRREGMRNPQRIAIVQHLEATGECSAKQILSAMLDRGVVTADELEANPHWLSQRLSHLHEGARVSRRTNEEGVLVWFVGTALAETASEPLVARPGVAKPRHIDVMNGPLYLPPCPSPARAGALDFARAPSLMGSRRVPFRSAP